MSLVNPLVESLVGPNGKSGGTGPGIAINVATNGHFPQGEVGVAYFSVITGEGGVSPYDTYFRDATGNNVITMGGLTISANHIIGTPTQATNAINSLWLPIEVNVFDSSVNAFWGSCGPPEIVNKLVSIAAGSFFTSGGSSIVVYGGGGTVSLALVSGVLPPGMATDNTSGTWVIVGSSITPGIYTFSLRATDSLGGDSGVVNYTVRVYDNSGADTNIIGYPQGQAAQVGNAFSNTPGINGPSSPPYTISMAGSLPATMSFNTADGTISGTPVSGDVGTHTVTVSLTNSHSITTQTDYTLVIVP